MILCETEPLSEVVANQTLLFEQTINHKQQIKCKLSACRIDEQGGMAVEDLKQSKSKYLLFEYHALCTIHR